jgi:hypothetical protein
MREPAELLYESEASLRLVDHAIEELGAGPRTAATADRAEPQLATAGAQAVIEHLSTSGIQTDHETPGFLQHVMAQPGGFAELSRTLLRAYAETARIATCVHESRSVLESGGIERLHHMQGKLDEISSATELATADVLDAVSRSVDLVDRLAADEGQNTAKRGAIVTQLRTELNDAMDHLQFQDITSQQLNYIQSLLVDMRQRLEEMAKLFGPYFVSFAKEAPAVGTFDPNATTQNAETRQAIADEIFSTQRKTA